MKKLFLPFFLYFYLFCLPSLFYFRKDEEKKMKRRKKKKKKKKKEKEGKEPHPILIGTGLPDSLICSKLFGLM